MRVGIVINSAWNIYNFRKPIVQALRKNGHEVVAIAPTDVYVKKLEDLGCSFVHVAMEGKSRNPINDLRLCLALVKIYREQKLDIVLHYTIKPNVYGTLAARWVGVPSINSITGLGTVFIRKGVVSFIAHTLYRFALHFANLVFFQNDDDRKEFIAKKLVEPSITRLVPGSGVDTLYFAPNISPRNEPFVFLLIGRLLYDKGIVEYAEAARMLKTSGLKATFKLLGGFNEQAGLGIPEKTIEAWQQEGIIEYLGTADDVRLFIDQADCVVLPSYREGTPRSLLEAASKGKPLIATNVPGCIEVVKEGFNGYLCDSKSPSHLAQAMLKMATAPQDLLYKMGGNSRALVIEKFDQTIVVEKYLEAIRATIQK